MISWNYTSWLDIAAVIAGGIFLVLYLGNRGSGKMHARAITDFFCSGGL